MKVYEIEIELAGIEPRIWRKVIIEETAPLDMLHLTIQGAMGWLNYHLHEFEIGETIYDETTDVSPVLSTILKKGMTFSYCYDLGDSWLHKLTVTKIREEEQPHDLYHKCIGGAKACPPEDTGGVPGYERLVSVLKNKSDSDHKSMKHWAGGFDPDIFSVTQASALICALRALSS